MDAELAARRHANRERYMRAFHAEYAARQRGDRKAQRAAIAEMEACDAEDERIAADWAAQAWVESIERRCPPLYEALVRTALKESSS